MRVGLASQHQKRISVCPKGATGEFVCVRENASVIRMQQTKEAMWLMSFPHPKMLAGEHRAGAPTWSGLGYSPLTPAANWHSYIQRTGELLENLEIDCEKMPKFVRKRLRG
ncbi:MAG TPA: hypothetical protein VM782_18945 [Stellaceae bacterium]|nr:hypothetical protein [Stellaceae bacterium]